MSQAAAPQGATVVVVDKGHDDAAAGAAANCAKILFIIGLFFPLFSL